MARKKLNVEKRVLRLYAGDTDTIKEFYPGIPYNAVVREIVHAFVENLKNGTNEPLVYDPHKLNVEDLTHD